MNIFHGTGKVALWRRTAVLQITSLFDNGNNVKATNRSMAGSRSSGEQQQQSRDKLHRDDNQCEGMRSNQWINRLIKYRQLLMVAV